MSPGVSLIDSTPYPEPPIDMLGTFEQTSDSALVRNITAQIEHSGAELMLDAKHPQWQNYRETLVEQVMHAYIARKLIRVANFKVHWFDSYSIFKHLDGSATVCWFSLTGAESHQHFQIHTNLLHSVGREAIRQGYGAVEYKRGQYQLHPDCATFKLLKD